jgi:23S rRNA (guanosine2251-2'-O)-methyltransferase
MKKPFKPNKSFKQQGSGSPQQRPFKAGAKPASKSQDGGKSYDKKPGGKPNHRAEKADNRGEGKTQHRPREQRAPGLKIALYGQHAVTAAWLNPKRNVHALYVSPAQEELAANLRKQAKDRNLQRPDPVVIDPARFDQSLPPHTAHQGIGLSVSPLDQPSLEDLLGALDPDQPATLVMLDQVTDPHNVGAILRSVAAFGGIGVIVQSRHAPEPNATMGKTACGALDTVPMCYEVNLSRSIELAKEYGFTAIGFDERGEKLVGEVGKLDRKILVMGAEGEGLRRLVRDHCDLLVRLPTTDAMPSLNVSNATAVALYALM